MTRANIQTYRVNFSPANMYKRTNVQPIISIESNENSRSLTARKTEKGEPRIHAPTADSNYDTKRSTNKGCSQEFTSFNLQTQDANEIRHRVQAQTDTYGEGSGIRFALKFSNSLGPHAGQGGLPQRNHSYAHSTGGYTHGMTTSGPWSKDGPVKCHLSTMLVKPV